MAQGPRNRCFISPPHLGLAEGGASSELRVAAQLAHGFCCTENRSSFFLATAERGFSALTRLHKPIRVSTLTEGSREARIEWARALEVRNLADRHACWPHPSGSPWNLFFQANECCNRPFLDVNIAVVGVAKAATFSLMKLLDGHPEIAAPALEDDALAGESSIGAHDVMLYNLWAQRLRASKPDLPARLVAVKHPLLMYNQRRLWRLAQIPGLKVVVILREPTDWLASMYNFFVEDCLRNETVRTVDALRFSNLCCKANRRVQAVNVLCEERYSWDEIPSFWEDVVGRGLEFSVAGIGRHHGLFHQYLDSLELFFEPSSVALLDFSLLADEPAAEAALQQLAGFLGARRPFEASELRAALREVAASRGGHEAHRVSFERVRVCGASAPAREDVNAVYAEARRELNSSLEAWRRAGAFVATSEALVSPPC